MRMTEIFNLGRDHRDHDDDRRWYNDGWRNRGYDNWDWGHRGWDDRGHDHWGNC